MTVSEESKKFLEQVKKGKPRNFAIVTKGVKIVALLVKKKPIKSAETKDLKKSAKGQKIFVGVVDGKGQDISFKMKADDVDKPPGKELMLKDFLLSQAEFKCKPSYELVQELVEVDDDEEAGNVEAGPDVDVDPQVEILAKEYQSLKAGIRDFVRLHPDERRIEILKPAKVVDDFVSDPTGDLQAAQDALAVIRELVNEPPPSDSPVSGDSPSPQARAGELAENLKALKPGIDKLINAQPDLKQELFSTMASIANQIKQQQFDGAQEAITTFDTRLRELSANIAISPLDVETKKEEWEQLRQDLEQRLNDAKRADPEKATGLQNVWDFADQQAEAENYGSAIKALKGLALKVTETLEQAAQTDPERYAIEQGLVAYRVWNATKKQITTDIQRLKKVATDDFPEEAAAINRLDEIVTRFNQGLGVTLEAARKAKSKQEVRNLRKRAGSIIDEYLEFAYSELRIRQVDQNPYFDMNIQKPMITALNKLSDSLNVTV